MEDRQRPQGKQSGTPHHRREASDQKTCDEGRNGEADRQHPPPEKDLTVTPHGLPSSLGEGGRTSEKCRATQGEGEKEETRPECPGVPGKSGVLPMEEKIPQIPRVAPHRVKRKKASAVRVVAAATSSRVIPRTPAMVSATRRVCAGSARLPRWGTGAR